MPNSNKLTNRWSHSTKRPISYSGWSILSHIQLRNHGNPTLLTPSPALKIKKGVIYIFLWHTAQGRCDHSGTGLIHNNNNSNNKNKNPLILFSVYLKQFDMRQKKGGGSSCSVKMILESAKLGLLPKKTGTAEVVHAWKTKQKKTKRKKTCHTEWGWHYGRRLHCTVLCLCRVRNTWLCDAWDFQKKNKPKKQHWMDIEDFASPKLPWFRPDDWLQKDEGALAGWGLEEEQQTHGEGREGCG